MIVKEALDTGRAPKIDEGCTMDEISTIIERKMYYPQYVPLVDKDMYEN